MKKDTDRLDSHANGDFSKKREIDGEFLEELRKQVQKRKGRRKKRRGSRTSLI